MFKVIQNRAVGYDHQSRKRFDFDRFRKTKRGYGFRSLILRRHHRLPGRVRALDFAADSGKQWRMKSINLWNLTRLISKR
jgi:hypothetical protein